MPVSLYPIAWLRGDVLQRSRDGGPWRDVGPVRTHGEARIAARAVKAFRDDPVMRFRLTRTDGTVLS